jgi:CheY-like chemotaxis protein
MIIKYKNDKPRILIVDDEAFMRDLIKSFYSNYDFELIEAANGQEALEAARAYSLDLILLDILMPVMNGYEAAALLKADESLKAIPLIIITGQERMVVDEHIKDMYDAFLIKPFEKIGLIKATMDFLLCKK